MCGRYCLDENPRALATRFGLPEPPALTARWNIAPGARVLTIRASAHGREAETMTWGLLPPWARQDGGFARPVNARAETLAQRPAFRTALRRHRCILPASGFYEWQARPATGTMRAHKQPWYVHPAAGGVFALAGLFEPGLDGAPATCCIVTTDANVLVAPIHDRMPAILDDAGVKRWLDPAIDGAGTAATLLRPCPPAWLAMHPVDMAVNATRTDNPELIRPRQPEA